MSHRGSVEGGEREREREGGRERERKREGGREREKPNIKAIPKTRLYKVLAREGENLREESRKVFTLALFRLVKKKPAAHLSDFTT